MSDATTYKVPSTYTAAQLVTVVYLAKQNPQDSFVTPEHDTMSAAQYLEWFYGCLTSKINRGEKPRGRKDNLDWYWQVRRLSRMVNGRAIVRSGDVPRELRSRLAHRLHDDA